jgi:hypothetical protein
MSNDTLITLKVGLAGFDSEAGEGPDAVPDVKEASNAECPLNKRLDGVLVPLSILHIAFIRCVELRVVTFFERGHGLLRLASVVHPLVVSHHAIDVFLEEGVAEDTVLLVRPVVTTDEYRIHAHRRSRSGMTSSHNKLGLVTTIAMLDVVKHMHRDLFIVILTKNGGSTIAEV